MSNSPSDFDASEPLSGSDHFTDDAASAALVHELEEAILSFEDIQAELNYRQAQDVLHRVVEKLNLSPRERSGLEAEISSLETMVSKLDNMVVQIAVFGMVGRGKSSLLNALLGQEVFDTGPTHGITQTVQTTQWSVRHEHLTGSDRDILRVSLPATGQSQIELIDTPGIDEVNGEARDHLARDLARQADLILFVVAGDITKVEYEALAELRKASKPMLLVLNKVDQYPPADRDAIYQTIRDRRVRELLSPDEIVMAAAAPRLATAVKHDDGRLVTRLRPTEPQVEALKLKILDILQREGKALVALNTMLFTNNVAEKVTQRKAEIRDRAANQLIWNAVITKALAIALNPVTVVDLLGGAVVDVAMILTLARLYGLPMTQSAAIRLLQSIALSMGGISAGELIATLGLGSLKSMLGLSAPATGGLSLSPYVTVALTQAGIAGVSTHAIGQITKTYLLNGASWGDADPKAVVRQILETLDQDSILSRIETELRSKIGDRFSESPQKRQPGL